MFKYALGFILILIACSQANQGSDSKEWTIISYNTSGTRVKIGGIDCIVVVKGNDGVATSCNWNGRN